MSPFKKRKSSIFFYLPEELMMDVWLKLPIKSTVRFRCVSKPCCAALSDPQFVYKNLTLLENEKEDLLLVLDLHREYYSVVSHEPLLAAAPLQPSPLLNVPVEDEHHIRILTYSCDDLVCFHNECGEGMGVWNLTTGETKILPSLDDDEFTFDAIGFGFDDKIKDYKIVQIGGYCQGVHQVYVYSLLTGDNCWRKLDQPNVPNNMSIGSASSTYCRSYRDGVFYWCDSRDKIISFDMCSEVFNTISFPGLFEWKRICKLKNESMLLISGASCVYDLWALLDVGVSSSLTKLLRIDWHYENNPLSLMGFWRNELVFEFGWERLIMGDPFQEPKEVEIDEPLEIVSCLVWTKGKNLVAFN